jgi:hypothetical protein
MTARSDSILALSCASRPRCRPDPLRLPRATGEPSAALTSEPRVGSEYISQGCRANSEATCQRLAAEAVGITEQEECGAVAERQARADDLDTQALDFGERVHEKRLQRAETVAHRPLLV